MKTLFITPLVIFLVLVLVFMAKLLETETPANLESIGKPLPEINLPVAFQKNNVLNTAELKGQYYLLNIFASWCITCVVEHPTLMHIKENEVLPVYGIAWRDKPEDLKNWLEKRGNPYELIGLDDDGKAIIELGVTGAPETFLVSPEGIILYRYAGVVTREIFYKEIVPLVK